MKKNAALLSDPTVVAELAFAIQSAIVSALVTKMKDAIEQTGIHDIAISGGVAANRSLRKQCETLLDARLWCPTPLHCVDNAAMIGFAGAYRLRLGAKLELNADVLPQWPVEMI